MRVAFIPARGGSKRIPRKNVRPFRGKPMIAWPIEAARASGLFEHIVVSTDDEEIARVAKACGGEVPFARPASLADDHAGTVEVIGHATRWALDQGWSLSAVCCIYATAPFLLAGELERGLRALESGPWAFAFSACEHASSVYRSFRRRDDGGVEMLFPEHERARSQDLPVVLHDAAQFYWGRAESWLEGKPIFARHSVPVILPSWRVLDIDREEDWQRAEVLAPAILRLGPTGQGPGKLKP